MSVPLTDRTKARIVRACRTTLGDELRRVRIVTGDRRERLYDRDDLPPEPDDPPDVGLRERDGGPDPDPDFELDPDPDPDLDGDAYWVVVDVTGAGCAVFVGRDQGSACRCDPESVLRFGEVETAVAAIVGSDGARSRRRTD